MATITLSNPTFYQDGTVCTGKVVGRSIPDKYTVNRVARYSFTSPNTGASSVSLIFANMHYTPADGKTRPTSFRFYIGTDADSHINAGASSTCTGTVKLLENSYTEFAGSADILLLPNTKYYLFVFPATSTYGWYSWEGTSAMTSSGGAGLIYIDDGSGWSAYQVYIDNGSSWDMYMPYIDTGSSWNLYS